MAFDADPAATHDPATGTDAPASWGDTINGNFAAIGGAWTLYTPTWTNLTVGNGVVKAAYLQWGKRVECRGTFKFGSTTSVTGSFTVSLPVAPKSAVSMIGTAFAVDASAGFVRTIGAVDIDSAVFGTALNFSSNGTASWTATAPVTWATNDLITWYITYEAA